MALLEKDCQAALELASLDIEQFYKNDILIFKGKTRYSGIDYNEVASSYVKSHLDEFMSITPPSKTTPYISKVLKQYDINQKNLNTRKIISLALYQQGVFECGKILDCQTPLYDNVKPKTLDRIDLILKAKTKELFLLNLKPRNSEQSMLRIIVESMIIYQKTNDMRLKRDLKLSKDTTIKFAPLVFKDSYAYKQLFDVRPELFKLIETLKLDIFIVESKMKNYSISRLNYTDIVESKLAI